MRSTTTQTTLKQTLTDKLHEVKMTINTVNICGIPYRVTEHQPNFDANTKHFGQVDFLGAEIRINHNMAEVIKTETLVHEIVHAILVHIGRAELSEDEVLVQSLANAINQTFKVKED